MICMTRMGLTNFTLQSRFLRATANRPTRRKIAKSTFEFRSVEANASKKIPLTMTAEFRRRRFPSA